MGRIGGDARTHWRPHSQLPQRMRRELLRSGAFFTRDAITPCVRQLTIFSILQSVYMLCYAAWEVASSKTPSPLLPLRRPTR